jgi:hypothetical protein
MLVGGWSLGVILALAYFRIKDKLVQLRGVDLYKRHCEHMAWVEHERAIDAIVGKGDWTKIYRGYRA